MSALPVPVQHKFFTPEEVEQLVEYILYDDIYADVCADIESNHAKIYLHDWYLHGVGFCVNEARVYITDKDLIRFMLNELRSQGRRIIGHNFKFDQLGLLKGGVMDDFYYNFVDTYIIKNMVDENAHQNQIGLKALVKTTYGYQMGNWEEESQYNKKTGAVSLDTPRFHFYGCDDVYWNLKYWKEHLEKEYMDGGFDSLWEDITKMGTIYVAEMEQNGMYINLQETKERVIKWAEIRAEVEKEIRAMVGSNLNIASNAQLKKLFFEDWGWPTEGLKLTKTGQVSLDAEGLDLLHQRYGKKYPALDKIVRWRNCNKMIGTYLLPNAQRSLENGDGRVYPDIDLTSVTGRKRCKNPNLQNQPNIYDDVIVGARKWLKQDLGIRRTYEAPEGRLHIVSDLSQAELRFCAHISQDEAMMSAYSDFSCGKCGHSGSSNILKTECPNCGNPADEDYLKGKNTTGFWHGKDIHQMTADATGISRTDSKSVNFAAIYCASAWTMHNQFGVYDVDRWDEILRGFFRLYSGVRRWHKYMDHLMNTDGYVHDLFGRRRVISKQMIRIYGKRALNMFVNFPVQASGAHYLMIAERKIRDEFIKRGWWNVVIWPVLEVHDEIVFEVLEEYAEECAKVIQYYMRYAAVLDVPMDSDIAITKSWGLCK